MTKKKNTFVPKEKEPEPCLACNGSGYYDNDGAPPCSGCGGTGLEGYDENGRKYGC